MGRETRPFQDGSQNFQREWETLQTLGISITYPICISLKTTVDDDGGDGDEECLDFFLFVSFVRIFFGNRLCRCDSIGPKIVKIGAILVIFKPFEDFSLKKDISEIQ